MVINRARAADEMARQQMAIEREKQAAETIYRQQALRQQNEQQQLNAFLTMLTNAQREAQGRDELGARERIAGLPYGPEAMAEAQRQREALIKAEEIRAKRLDPWMAREQYQVQQDEKAIAEETTATKAQLDSIADDLNKAVKQADAVRLKAHQDVDAPSLGKSFGAAKRTIFGYPGAVIGGSKGINPSGTSKEHADIDAAFLAELKKLQDSIAKNFQGLIVLRNNRFQVNAAGLGVPTIRVPQAPPASTNAVPVLPPMTNAVPSMSFNFDPFTRKLVPVR